LKIKLISELFFITDEMAGRHSRHVNAAIDQALKSSMEHKHGAVAVRRGKRVSSGYNKNQNRFLKETVPSIHAELAALQSLICQNARARKERLLRG
jgi:tRNA(Arg) A34 adenosine deaminase TadA